jgi:hypothetical protein
LLQRQFNDYNVVKSDDASALRELTVVQNWFDDLQRRGPAPSK